MKHLVKARVLIAELVDEELIEARRPDAVGRALAEHLEQLDQLPSGFELEEWLEEHRLVGEVYAGADVLGEVLNRHFGAAFAGPVVVHDARHPELEKSISESPGSVEHYLVYSDWLQERSDPLGELIALGVAAADGDASDKTRFERHLKSYEDHFLGGAAKQIPEQVTLEWRFGLVHTVNAVSRLDTETWKQLLQLRVCQFLQGIKVSLHWSYEVETTAAVLSILDHGAPDSLHTLSLDGFHDLSFPEALLRHKLDSIRLAGGRATLPDAFPGSLRQLRLRVHDVTQPNRPGSWDLQALDVDITPQMAKLMTGLALPHLERLTLDIRRCTESDLPAFLEALETPSLSHLELRGGRLHPKAFGAIARLPVARRLTSLALTRLALTDQSMEALVEERTWFEALAVLDVSNNELSRHGLDAARALAPEVVSRRQERPGTAAHNRLRKFAGSRLQPAEKIADPALWRNSGVDGDLLWARYRGTEDYELFVTRDLGGYGCSCPSSIQPCKHVVALALVAEKGELKQGSSGGIRDRIHRRIERFLDDDDW